MRSNNLPVPWGTILASLEQKGREWLGELYDSLALPPMLLRENGPLVVPFYLDEEGYPVIRLAPFPVLPSYLVSGQFTVRLERVVDRAVEVLYPPASTKKALVFIGEAVNAIANETR